jgi:hypothetical protein
MSQEHEQDTMREEYDFSGGVRGKLVVEHSDFEV